MEEAVGMAAAMGVVMFLLWATLVGFSIYMMWRIAAKAGGSPAGGCCCASFPS